MKKITFILSCLILFIGVNAQTFSDGFEGDTLGLLGPQSTQWRTWSGAGGGLDDVQVVDSDNHTPNGSKSIYFFSDDWKGGPANVVLPFSNVPLNTGELKFSTSFKIAEDKGAYFTFQGDTALGSSYVLKCFMSGTSLMLLTVGGEQLFATIPTNTWFNIAIEVNFNKNNWKLLVDGNVVVTWKSIVNRAFAVTYRPNNPDAEFWVDDVSYKVIPYTFPSINATATAINVPDGFVGASFPVSFNVRNLGLNPITSFDVNVSQNNGAPVKSSVTGVNITSLNSASVTLSEPVILAAGVNSFTAAIANVNGFGPDGDVNDDTLLTTALGVEPAFGKNIAAEEGTGTWDKYSPHGAVFMDMMTEKYKNRFIGIAVHDYISDPMTVPAYDDNIGFLLFPRVMIDRIEPVDPTFIESNFLQRIVVAPDGILVNGATFDAVTRELKVSVTTTIQNNIAGDFKVACVLTEDSVTGTDDGYRQANIYSGGARVVGGFELLPDPVPAAMMNYNAVARALSPNFDGLSNAYGLSATVGQVVTHNFSFIVSATWDINQIHIIGLMMDPDGLIDNAASATIKEAVANGFIKGTVVIGIKNLDNSPDAIQLKPNPTSDVASISINLKTEASISVSIYAANGRLMASKSYGKIVGAYQLPIDVQKFAKGIYFVKVNVNDQQKIVKLIKE